MFTTIVTTSTIIVCISNQSTCLQTYKFIAGVYCVYCFLCFVQSAFLYKHKTFALLDIAVYILYFAMLIVSIYGLRLYVPTECKSEELYVLGQLFMWGYFAGLFATTLLAFALTLLLTWVLLCNPRILARTIERVGPNTTGISHETIQTLNHQQYNPYTSALTDTTCTICMSNYASGDEFIVLPCGDGKHHFHKACIEPWLLRNATCPCCRAVIGEEQSTPVEP